MFSLLSFVAASSGFGGTLLLLTMCVQCLGKTERLGWSLSSFTAHKSHVYFYHQQSGVSLEETPKQRPIWLPQRPKQPPLVSRPSEGSKDQQAHLLEPAGFFMEPGFWLSVSNRWEYRIFKKSGKNDRAEEEQEWQHGELLSCTLEQLPGCQIPWKAFRSSKTENFNKTHRVCS